MLLDGVVYVFDIPAPPMRAAFGDARDIPHISSPSGCAICPVYHRHRDLQWSHDLRTHRPEGVATSHKGSQAYTTYPPVGAGPAERRSRRTVRREERHLSREKEYRLSSPASQVLSTGDALPLGKRPVDKEEMIG